MNIFAVTAIIRWWIVIQFDLFSSLRLRYNSTIGRQLLATCLKSPKTSQLLFLPVSTVVLCHGNNKRRNELYAVPKKKPSKRRTRIRKTAWMKRYPLNWKQPMMLDIFDVVKYTDGTLTKARTTHQSWLNLPNTKLEGEHFLTKELRPRW